MVNKDVQLYRVFDPLIGPALKFKMKHSMDWTDFYKKFLKSVHFPSWLQKKTILVKSEIHRQFLEVACRRKSVPAVQMDDQPCSPQMENFEIVNVILFLKSQLVRK